MDYELSRHAADSWGLLFLTLVFVSVVLFVFRRGSKRLYRDVADIPLRDDNEPEAPRDE